MNLKEIVKNYICDECTGEATEYVTNTKHSSTNAVIHKWTLKMNTARAIYLKSIKDRLLPFTTKKDLDKILKSKSRVNSKEIMRCKKLLKTPDYMVDVTMRDYQLEGTSTLISWFARGVGGILADEMGKTPVCLFSS